MKQAQDNAGTLIVSIRLSLAAFGKPVVVVGADTNLLVMLVTSDHKHEPVYVMQLESHNTTEFTIFKHALVTQVSI